jgi:uncharacterized protein YdaU (DUF1376 family)
MATIPYMQLYVADYLADTVHLDTIEHGAYLLILMNYWQTEKPIPANRLRKIAKLSPDQWTDVEQSLNEFFEIDPDTGDWVHARIELDLEVVRSKSLKNSRAGKASAEKRRLQALEKDKVSNKRPTKKKRTSNHKDKDKDKDKTVTRTYPEKLNLPAWKEYIQHRIDMKIKPLSLRGEEKKIEELCGYSKEHQQRTVNATIGSGWQGLFPEKQSSTGSKSAGGSMLDTLSNL